MVADAKGYQDSAVQNASSSSIASAAGKVEAKSLAGSMEAAATGGCGDEPDRMHVQMYAEPFEALPEDRHQGKEDVDDDVFSVGPGGVFLPVVTEETSSYPEFPETNPFRFPTTAAPAGASVRRREPLLRRASSSDNLARRRGSASELRIVIPPQESPQAAGSSGAAMVAQRALCGVTIGGDGGSSGPSQVGAAGWDLGRRDSIWDRLPPPDGEENLRTGAEQGATSRFLRSPFSLAASAPTPDQTNEEGRTLFLEFVRDRIEEDIEDDERREVHNDEYFNRIMALPGLSNPVWAQTGTELRALADAFATSHQRQELRCKAQHTDLTHITWDRFRQLLEELFSGEAGVTQERILVLFFFLSDCVIATIRRHAWQHLRRLIEWSLRYIVERVCALVQQAGGWGVVLRQSVEYVYLALKMATLGLVCTAAFVYIRKSWN